MNPLTFEQILTLVSVLTAVFLAIMTVRRDTSADRERDTAHAAERQAIVSKLDQISDMSRETRDTVRELNRSVNDHGQLLAKHTEQITTLFQRVETVEHRCERHFGDGVAERERGTK